MHPCPVQYCRVLKTETVKLLKICFLTTYSALWLHSRILRMQKLKAHLLRTQSSKFLPSKLGVGQNMAMYASPTARDSVLN